MNGDLIRTILSISNSVKRELDSNNKERNLDMSGAQVRCLHVIQRAEEKGENINQKELEMIFNIQKSSMSQLLATMEEKNLIVRVPSLSDSRIKNITLTKKGKEISLITYNDIANIQAHSTKDLSDKDLEITLNTLAKIRNKIEGGKHEEK